MYLSLVLAPDAPEVAHRPLVPLSPDGKKLPTPPDDAAYGVSVDAGTVCFVDDSAVARSMATEESTWYETIFDDGSQERWFARMDDPANIRPGVANISLPTANGEPPAASIIICPSGMGDGFYPVLGGFDVKNRLVAVHIDLLLLPS